MFSHQGLPIEHGTWRWPDHYGWIDFLEAACQTVRLEVSGDDRWLLRGVRTFAADEELGNLDVIHHL